MLRALRPVLLSVACATVVVTGAPLLAPVDAASPPGRSAAVGEGPAPLVASGTPRRLDGRYIVVMKEQATARQTHGARATAVDHGGLVIHDYKAVLRGFAARLPDEALRRVRADPDVAYVEADQRVTIDGEQSGATWGLDRVDQRRRPLNSTYRYGRTGLGVRAYVIDTGIRAGHQEFGGRVTRGFTSVRDGRGSRDCNGHGTHVAGTVGGRRYGVAKRVTLVPVRVLNCQGSGTTSGVLAGVDWVTSNHRSAPAVANMSLGGSASDALDDAVTRSIGDRITYAVAAGNSDTNACGQSPARVPAALTVGATGKRDGRASFSNYGSCLDLFAPGTRITSAWNGSNSATNTISGTSMATPHVAGAAALYLQRDRSARPGRVGWKIRSTATTSVVRYRAGSPDRLLYSRVRR